MTQPYPGPQAPQPGQQYGQPPVPPATVNAPGAVASLVCGIIGCVTGVVGLVLGIIALVQSSKAKKMIAASPGMYGGKGMATTGFVLGIIATVGGGIYALWMILAWSSFATLFGLAQHARF